MGAHNATCVTKVKVFRAGTARWQQAYEIRYRRCRLLRRCAPRALTIRIAAANSMGRRPPSAHTPERSCTH